MIKVAIANDTLIALEALRRVIAQDSSYQLIWTARNGAEAIAHCWRDRPDLILMDLLMPEIDGVEATRQIMARSPCAILIVTASVHRNTSKVFEAMGHGALDVVKTPALGLQVGRAYPAADPLLAKMATVATFIGKSHRSNRLSQSTLPAGLATAADLIVIGASTGGPKALAKIFAQLPANLPAAITVVQHIDRQFAPGLAEWLNSQSPLPVALARHGEVPQLGKILIAQAENHLVMRRDRTLAYTPAPEPTPYCPSVDLFFKSVAQHWPRPGQAVLLTGMGRDGAQGLAELQAAGWNTVAESEASCVVYGMPRAAVEIGAANQILPLEEISQALRSPSKRRRRWPSPAHS